MNEQPTGRRMGRIVGQLDDIHLLLTLYVEHAPDAFGVRASLTNARDAVAESLALVEVATRAINALQNKE